MMEHAKILAIARADTMHATPEEVELLQASPAFVAIQQRAARELVRAYCTLETASDLGEIRRAQGVVSALGFLLDAPDVINRSFACQEMSSGIDIRKRDVLQQELADNLQH